MKMMKCPAKKNQSKDNSCTNNSCNPFMACAYGNFFTGAFNAITVRSVSQFREKIAPANDNRITDISPDCWHPPRIDLQHSI